MNNKAQVRAAFHAGGEKAARKKGEQIGVKPATLDAYIKRFLAGKELDDKPEPRSAGKTKDEPQLKALRFGDTLAKGVAVFDIGDPRNVGKVAELGPEVSRVDFRGTSRVVSNAYLQCVAEGEAKRKQQLNKALASLAESRVWVVKKWLAGLDKRPDDREIWHYICKRWPTVDKRDLEPVYQET